jgi:hypothetical protein
MKAMAAWFGLATSVAVEVQICTLCRITIKFSRDAKRRRLE